MQRNQLDQFVHFTLYELLKDNRLSNMFLEFNKIVDELIQTGKSELKVSNYQGQTEEWLLKMIEPIITHFNSFYFIERIDTSEKIIFRINLSEYKDTKIFQSLLVNKVTDLEERMINLEKELKVLKSGILI